MAASQLPTSEDMEKAMQLNSQAAEASTSASTGPVVNPLQKVLEQAMDDSDSEGEGEGDEGAEFQFDGTLKIDKTVAKKSKKTPKAFEKLKSALSNDSKLQKELIKQVKQKVEEQEGIEAAKQLDGKQVSAMLKQMKVAETLKGKTGIGGINSKDMGSHKFWSTQPVGSVQNEDDQGPVDAPTPYEDIQKEPYALPKDFVWSEMDLNNPDESKEVHELLSLNYVEDNEATYRFKYSAEFLTWALKVPGYHKSWHIGVRVASSKKLVAFISGIPQEMRIRSKTFQSAEINFLCVHKKLRSKRLAPVLIKEVTRQCHLKGVFQAVYTAGVILPGVVSTSQYLHRVINAQKLVSIGFAATPRNMTLPRYIKSCEPASSFSIPGFREFFRKDIKPVARLLRAYLSRFSIAPVFTNAEIENLFFKSRGKDDENGTRVGQVVWAYVVEDPTTKRITDFISFYSLPSTVVKSAKHPLISVAYLYYYATDIVLPPDYETNEPYWSPDFVENPSNTSQLKERLSALTNDLLIVAQKTDHDLMNALTGQDNAGFLPDIKFANGTGYLNYYLYNYKSMPFSGGTEKLAKSCKDCPRGMSSEIGLVLL